MSTESTIDKAVDTGIKALSFLTWNKLLQLIALLLVLGLAAYSWENRPHIYESINLSIGRFGLDHIPTEIAETSRKEIKFMVDRSPSIVAAQLVNVDFRRNEKHPVYFYSDVSVLQTEMDVYEADKVANTPLFISGDEVNNSRIVSIINGEFVCVPLPEHVKTVVPTSGKVAAAVCSISVPPYFGKIVGYANIWVDHMPKPDEVPDYRAITRSMSVSVYERDVKANSGV